MMKFSLIVIILTFIAFSRVIYGSTTSLGSLPDMRYFSPLYLPLSIISILLLSPLIMKTSEQYLKYLSISVFICAPILVIGTASALPYGFTNFMCTNFFMKILIFLVLLIFGLHNALIINSIYRVSQMRFFIKRGVFINEIKYFR